MMSDTETRQVLDALSANRVMAKDADGNYTREVTPKVITDAIAICEASLARVVEPVAYVHFAKKKPGVKVLSWQKQVSASNKALGFISEPLYATPQAAAQPSQAEELSDTILIDWLQSKGENWTCRDSETGRGWRLHQSSTSERNGVASVRAAIIAAINAKGTP